MKSGPAPGPDTIPDHTVINAEHTWSQSRFNANEPRNSQLTDLHHLFPTDSEMNRIRGNYQFGEVDDAKARKLRCDGNEIGPVLVPSGLSVPNAEPFYEVPAAHKGNVARALFYFAVRYRAAISPVEEYYMRQWHRSDPVDAADITRNNEIQKIQGNRNPFIDYPELVDAIPNFASANYKRIKPGKGDSAEGEDSTTQPKDQQKESGGGDSSQGQTSKDQTTTPKEQGGATPQTGDTSQSTPNEGAAKSALYRLENGTLNLKGSDGNTIRSLNDIVGACVHKNYNIPNAPFSSYEIFALSKYGTLHKIKGDSQRSDKTEKAPAGLSLSEIMAAKKLPCAAISAAQ